MRPLAAVIVMLALPLTSIAQLNVGSDGSDGILNPLSSVTIDLAAAPTGLWTDVSSDNRMDGYGGDGIYDPHKWAVVFKYESINIPSGVVVDFANHPAGAPVVWLVENDVTIDGTVRLNGKLGSGPVHAEAGPGGFRGGRNTAAGNPGSGGLGPGGGDYFPGQRAAGSYATPGTSTDLEAPTYGNVHVIPLIGGSGASQAANADGGAGGGAILLAAGGDVTLNGTIEAKGGDVSTGSGTARRGGSGGAVRIIAERIEGTGNVNALGTRLGGDGRVSFESSESVITIPSVGPRPRLSVPAAPPMLWPSVDAPAVAISTVEYIDINDSPQSISLESIDPHASVDVFETDISLETQELITVSASATKVPVDGSWSVNLRLVRTFGDSIPELPMAYTEGDLSNSVWTATFSLPVGVSVLQARAYDSSR